MLLRHPLEQDGARGLFLFLENKDIQKGFQRKNFPEYLISPQVVHQKSHFLLNRNFTICHLLFALCLYYVPLRMKVTISITIY